VGPQHFGSDELEFAEHVDRRGANAREC
jgi:hypothetical protein